MFTVTLTANTHKKMKDCSLSTASLLDLLVSGTHTPLARGVWTATQTRGDYHVGCQYTLALTPEKTFIVKTVWSEPINSEKSR